MKAGAAFVFLASTTIACQNQISPPRQSINETPMQRAELAVDAMTLDEKISMLSGTFGASVLRVSPDEKRIGAGHVPGVPRLGIPDLWESDASLGVSNVGDMRKDDVATALPSSLATASTFDPSIAYAGGAMIGSEARAKGFNVLLAGGANLIRDPWGGRAFEYLSEDPLLTGIMAGEAIRGVQSNDIISTIKHFALNPQESGRYVMDAQIEEAAFRESDLLAFEIAIELGQPGSVMAAYNKVNGHWASENHHLIKKVLKEDWSYEGWVMSDWGSVHSTVKAALAGLDQQSGIELDRQHFFGAPLKEAVLNGQVSQDIIDDKVRRIVHMMFKHGVVDRPAPTTPQSIDYESNGAIAQAVAEAGMVLLKNDGAILPIPEGTRTIAVIGGRADIGVLSGGGSSQVRSVGGYALEIPMEGAGPFTGVMTRRYHSSSPLLALRERAKDTNVTFSSGQDIAEAVEAAEAADLVVVFAEEWRTEVLDDEDLKLSADQEALIIAITAANPKTVVVLQTGGPILMPWLKDVPAVLQAWYPGQRGGEAIARILFGDVNPSGHLPVTLPASADQAPRPKVPNLDQAKTAFERVMAASFAEIGEMGLSGGQESFSLEYVEGADVGYRWYARNGYEPEFPFGYGLSYTTFSYQDLTLASGKTPVASFTISNTGNREGADVAQLYAVDDRGVPVLVGFSRISLQPGEQKRVTVPIDLRPMQSFDVERNQRVDVKGRIHIRLSASATDTLLEASLEN